VRDFFIKNRGLSARVAKISGVSPSYISNIINKKRNCPVFVALVIEKETNGSINLKKLLTPKEYKKFNLIKKL
jgi:DNA-binding transcriptional regulator YdaS (Cro superfamily)